jgi:tRNA(Ile)-lysidine synthase
MLRAAIEIKSRQGGKGQLFVAHLDHGLRGEASAADAEWLKTLCCRLSVPMEFGKADVAKIANAQRNGLEAAARTARYEFLQHAAEKLGARFVAVAHTADDQIETVLHRILRGTGIDGLRGIPAVRPLASSVTLIRPLLSARRRDVLEYLAAIGQDYRTDATNADPSWTRNRLRHELLPAIREHYPGDFDASLLQLSARASETQTILSSIVAPLVSECVTLELAHVEHATERPVCRIRVQREKLSDQPPLVIREVCKHAWRQSNWPMQAMRFDHWKQLAVLIKDESPESSVNLPGNVRACRDHDEVLIQRHGLP